VIPYSAAFDFQCLTHTQQRRQVMTARFMQLVYQEEQNVGFTNTSEAARHFSQAARQLPRRRLVELEDRQQFAEPPRRDSRAVDGADFARFDAVQRPDQPVEAGFEQIVACS
jgi:hypothetical protein